MFKKFMLCVFLCGLWSIEPIFAMMEETEIEQFAEASTALSVFKWLKQFNKSFVCKTNNPKTYLILTVTNSTMLPKAIIYQVTYVKNESPKINEIAKIEGTAYADVDHYIFDGDIDSAWDLYASFKDSEKDIHTLLKNYGLKIKV